MRLKPIPKRLLIHTIIYEEYRGDSTFGGNDFSPPEDIPFVLVQPKSELRRDATGVEIQIKGTIFLDAKNTPNFKRLKEESRIKFNGEDYRVVGCDALYTTDPNTPHHFEVDVR
ncbi:putative minor capsid protein [Alkalihalophilus marmarensis]|uniref:putative minor capsid protein n=1 Tax=Alkalihalophilus marmarensis TaxID=521377 RepID=UPI002E233A2E|nr:putative minor capsid protein [Alkalihalophilus marmarensis]